jgi:hypothetical protein
MRLAHQVPKVAQHHLGVPHMWSSMDDGQGMEAVTGQPDPV